MARERAFGLMAALLLVAGSSALVACFKDSGTPARACVAGQSTCACRSEDPPCDEGLVCDEADGVCRSARCQDGREGCACVDGELCLGDLQCIDKSCLPPTGGDDDGGSSPSTTNESTTAEVTTVMPGTTNPSEGSGVDVGPMTTEPVTVGDLPNATTGPATTGTVPCECGWLGGRASFYLCSLDLEFEDPSASFPRDCPDSVEIVSGGVCGEVLFEGCCVGEVLVWCDESTEPPSLVLDDCAAVGCTP